MDTKKTGRLITKRRMEMNVTQEKLAKMLSVSPQAVSAWVNGTNYPDAASQVMIHKVMDLNPVELLTGLEMYDVNLKNGISYYMSRIDENVFTGGIVTDEDGMESYLDMSGFKIVTTDENGELSDKWIPYLDYHNVKPHEMTEREKELKAMDDAVPHEQYDPWKVYINHGVAILIISRDILEVVGKPRFFNICWSEDRTWIGLQFGDSGTFDVPDEVYEGTCRGLMVEGGEFGRELCRKMGVRAMIDTMVVNPGFSEEHNMLSLNLKEAKRLKPDFDTTGFVLPTWQKEMELQEMMEEDEISGYN